MDFCKIFLSSSALISVVSFNSLVCRLSSLSDLLVSNTSIRLRIFVSDKVMLPIKVFTMYSGERGKGLLGSVVETERNC